MHRRYLSLLASGRSKCWGWTQGLHMSQFRRCTLQMPNVKASRVLQMSLGLSVMAAKIDVQNQQ